MVSNYTKHVRVLLVVTMVCCSAVAHALVATSMDFDLSGPWRVHLGDNDSWAVSGEMSDTSWDTLELPGNIAKYAFEKTGSNIGTAWLKKTVILPADLRGQDLGLNLGRISHADEVFFNGEKIGGEGAFPPHAMSMWNIARHYVVPGRLVRAGAENVISMRVWFHTYGDISGQLSLTDWTSWNEKKVRDIWVRIILNYAIIAMGVPLLLLFFLFYVQRPESTEYLLYCLQLLCGFFIIFDLCSLWRFPGGIDARFKAVAFSWIAINVVHPIFLHRLYELERKKIEWGLIAYLFLSLPMFIFVRSTEFRLYGLLVVFFSGSIGFYNLSCHFSALWLNKPFSRIFSLFGLTVVLGAIHDGLIYLSKLAYFNLSVFGYTFDHMLFPYSAAALYTGTAFILVYRFIDLLKNNEDLNENLENKVAERTRSLILLTEELEHQNIKLEEMAIRDSMTGLYNHAAFYDRLDEIFITSRKNKFPMAVAMIDVDDFKGFNDTYGHQAGDQVLMGIAAILKTSIREYDFSGKFQGNRMDDNRDYDLAGRCGGDEFMLVLPQCGYECALSVTERICSRIDQIRIDNHPDIRVSGSFGVAVLNGDTRCLDSETLVTLADLALYKSKAMGKNRVCCKVYDAR